MSVSGSTGAEFVQLVQQYPCLYNSDLPDYGRKEPTERAWLEIANEMDWCVSECKDKWKNIRNGYVRSMKPCFKDKPKKPYYLRDAMKFLLPFINPSINIPTNNQNSLLTNIEYESDDNYAQSDDNYYKKQAEAIAEAKAELKRARPQRKISKKKCNDVDKALISWLNRKPKVEDPRKMFLLSLLPDVSMLSEDQLGVFRIRVLLLLEEVKNQSSGMQDLMEQLN